MRLQDEYKANVCLLIAMCWLDARQHHLADEDFLALQRYIGRWTQEVVEPLRYLRRRLKSPFDSLAQDETQIELRNTLKQAELLAEKKLLMEIEKWVIKQVRVKDKAAHTKNLERYLSELHAPKDLVTIIQ